MSNTTLLILGTITVAAMLYNGLKSSNCDLASNKDFEDLKLPQDIDSELAIYLAEIHKANSLENLQKLENRSISYFNNAKKNRGIDEAFKDLDIISNHIESVQKKFSPSAASLN
jgi:hypothetical protein